MGEDAISHRVSLRASAQVTDVLSQTALMELPLTEKVVVLLEQLGPLLGAPLDFYVLKMDRRSSGVAPRVTAFVRHGPGFATKPAASVARIQQVIDRLGVVIHRTAPASAQNSRVPHAIVCSTDIEPLWLEHCLLPEIRLGGWDDCLCCYWAGSEERLVSLAALKPIGTSAFAPEARAIMLLLTQAVAPLMDHTLIVPLASELKQLKPAARAVLLPILQGYSNSEIAAFAHVPEEYVVHAEAYLLSRFSVATRGELIALFVERRILHWLEADAAAGFDQH